MKKYLKLYILWISEPWRGFKVSLLALLFIFVAIFIINIPEFIKSVIFWGGSIIFFSGGIGHWIWFNKNLKK